MVDAPALKEAALGLGFTAVGVCPADPPQTLDAYNAWLGKGYHGGMDYLAAQRALRADPQNLLPGARSVVAVALNYLPPGEPSAGPKIARYARGRDYHKVLRTKMRALGRWLEARQPGAAWRACVDSAPIFEREYAHRAGLGWFGKNTMLIDSRRGSWFFLGLLLTDLDLAPDTPAVGGCGTCSACIDACPTGCIVFEDGRWQIDAGRCISYLTIEHRGPLPDPRAIADWTFGCDVCQEVCPFNQPRPSQPQRARPTEEPDFRAERAWPDLERLAELTDEEWDVLTRGSAVRRAGLDGLRRNARANLDNRF